jgi:hypothetical protein
MGRGAKGRGTAPAIPVQWQRAQCPAGPADRVGARQHDRADRSLLNIIRMSAIRPGVAATRGDPGRSQLKATAQAFRQLGYLRSPLDVNLDTQRRALDELDQSLR